MVDDDFDESMLSESTKAALHLVDAMLTDPLGRGPRARAAALEHFDAGQVDELALGIALFHGFSKIAIALGPPPEMPTTIVPTPDWPPDVSAG